MKEVGKFSSDRGEEQEKPPFATAAATAAVGVVGLHYNLQQLLLHAHYRLLQGTRPLFRHELP